jgi:hypothetical protein
MNTISNTIGEAVETPAFKFFNVTKLDNGEYNVHVAYCIQISVNGSIISKGDQVTVMLTDAEVRDHPMFSSIYPLIQQFAISSLSTTRPDLVG